MFTAGHYAAGEARCAPRQAARRRSTTPQRNSNASALSGSSSKRSPAITYRKMTPWLRSVAIWEHTNAAEKKFKKSLLGTNRMGRAYVYLSKAASLRAEPFPQQQTPARRPTFNLSSSQFTVRSRKRSMGTLLSHARTVPLANIRCCTVTICSRDQ